VDVAHAVRFGCFWIGLYPKPFLEFLDQPVTQLAERIQPGVFTADAPTAVPRATGD